MSILGVVVRVRPGDAASTEGQLRALPGVEVPDRAGDTDGRLIVVIDDAEGCPAAARLGEIALWPQVINTSLVYEYSGSELEGDAVDRFADWRATLSDLASRRSR